MTPDLFDETPKSDVAPQAIAPGAFLLRGFACDQAVALLRTVEQVTATAPLRHLVTPGGYSMSVAMSNCGELGWMSDRSGYRYTRTDPSSGQSRAAAMAGFDDFRPDACLVNCYQPGARLSLHPDRDEVERTAPIVSVSLGLPAVFLFGTAQRSERPQRYRLAHGDVVVWGGPPRLANHGVAPLAGGDHVLVGRRRINLTFRHAGAPA